jgi:hypothetical protein
VRSGASHELRKLCVMSVARMVRCRVDRRLSPNGRRSETGAVATLVALLPGRGVLVGAAGLVIDTGSERPPNRDAALVAHRVARLRPA